MFGWMKALKMRYSFIILLLFSSLCYSQSVKIDGPTGLVSDLDTASNPVLGTDLVVIGRSGISKSVTFADFINPPHGKFFFHDSAVTPAAAQNTWEQVTNATKSLFILVDSMRLSFDGDSVTIQYPGDYLIIISFSFSGSAADSWEFAVFKNGAKTEVTVDRTTSQTDVGNVSVPVYLDDLVEGDGLTFKIRNVVSNDDPTFVSCSWVILRIHI